MRAALTLLALGSPSPEPSRCPSAPPVVPAELLLQVTAIKGKDSWAVAVIDRQDLVPQGPAVVLGGAPSSSQQPREARARRSFSNPPSGSHLGALGMGWRVGTMLQSVACPAPPYMTVVSPTPQALGQPKVPPCISQSPGETVPARTGVKTWPGSAGRSFQEHFS